LTDDAHTQSRTTVTVETDARATRARILDAAEGLFAEKGFDGAAMRDIATHAGLQPASLYNHFDGKQALYEAVLERGLAPLLEEIARIARAGLPTDGGDAILATLIASLGRTPRLPRLIQHEAARGGGHLARLARRFIRPLFEQGLTALKLSPEARLWEEDELPLLIGAWMHLLFGPFAMAPLLAEVLDTDPLSPENLALQTRFLQKVTRLMMQTPATTTDGQAR
jgi:AcrR family transcriptional regulator